MSPPVCPDSLCPRGRPGPRSEDREQRRCPHLSCPQPGPSGTGYYSVITGSRLPRPRGAGWFIYSFIHSFVPSLPLTSLSLLFSLPSLSPSFPLSHSLLPFSSLSLPPSFPPSLPPFPLSPSLSAPPLSSLGTLPRVPSGSPDLFRKSAASVGPTLPVFPGSTLSVTARSRDSVNRHVTPGTG